MVENSIRSCSQDQCLQLLYYFYQQQIFLMIRELQHHGIHHHLGFIFTLHQAPMKSLKTDKNTKNSNVSVYIYKHYKIPYWCHLSALFCVQRNAVIIVISMILYIPVKFLSVNVLLVYTDMVSVMYFLPAISTDATPMASERRISDEEFGPSSSPELHPNLRSLLLIKDTYVVSVAPSVV